MSDGEGEPDNKKPKLVDDRHIVHFKGGRYDDPIGIVLPANENLPLSELERAVPGANGINYLNTNTGYRLSLKFDKETQSFPPPLNGWSKDVIYQVAYKDSRSISPYMTAESPLPELKDAKQFCYFISKFDKENNEVRSPAICIHPFYFTTYGHTSKVVYEKDVTTVKVRKGEDYFNTVVKHVSIAQDFVLLKSDKKICEYGPQICKEHCSGFIYLYGGYTNEVTRLQEVKKTGCLQSPETEYVKWNNKRHGPYLVGNLTVSPGDSGSAVFCPHGLRGMNIGAMNFLDCPLKEAFVRCATYLPKCLIVPATDIINSIAYIEEGQFRKIMEDYIEEGQSRNVEIEEGEI